MRILLAVLCLTACSPQQVPTKPGETPAAQTDAQPGLPELRGEWRLVEMNGRAAAESLGQGGPPTPITMTIGDSTFRAQSQCIAFWRQYQRRGGRLALTHANPGLMCARGLTGWEREFDSALSAVTAAEIRSGTLRLTGPAVRLTFASAPAHPRERFNGRWRLRSFDGASPQDGEGSLEITVTDDQIMANACVFAGWRYRQAGGLLEVTQIEEPVCERTLTGRETRFAAFMTDLNRATLIPDGGLILDSTAAQLEFRRVE